MANLKCRTCGKDIPFGFYCPECAATAPAQPTAKQARQAARQATGRRYEDHEGYDDGTTRAYGWQRLDTLADDCIAANERNARRGR